ncbi:hypothetical protein H920_11297 [Fukomys damarensis]|uniref:Uncharacterized protein n=1 Tax=Fukomys damarensis TaxID=885580 RepID=A0A091D8B0_FUKDA|nr:hypothetical protein H920_11297 [Fukomys damarensis]
MLGSGPDQHLSPGHQVPEAPSERCWARRLGEKHDHRRPCVFTSHLFRANFAWASASKALSRVDSGLVPPLPGRSGSAPEMAPPLRPGT